MNKCREKSNDNQVTKIQFIGLIIEHIDSRFSSCCTTYLISIYFAF